MKHSLQLRLSQHLALTPQLQQSIRLLQLSTLELNQELERFLQDNPLLERDEGGADVEVLPAGMNGGTTTERVAETPVTQSEEAAPSADNDVFGSPEGYGSPREDDEYPQLAADNPSLREHLGTQLTLTQLADRDRTLVTLVIESLDEDGYLAQDLGEIQAMLPEELGVELEELQIALKHLQHFEPTGVGARNLAECLALQLTALPETTA